MGGFANAWSLRKTSVMFDGIDSGHQSAKIATSSAISSRQIVPHVFCGAETCDGVAVFLRRQGHCGM